MAEGKKAMQYIAALSASGGAFLLGILVGWTNPTQKAIQEGELGFKVTDAEFGSIGAAVTLGAAVMCIPSGFLINAIGRKSTIEVLALPLIIGWLLIIFAQNAIMCMAGRFLMGTAVGAFCVAIPSYISEIAQPEIRGTCGTFFQFLITIGILAIYIIGGYTSLEITNYICCALPLVNALIFALMPESPTYYVSKGKTEEATKSLKRLRGNEYDGSAELAEIVATDKQQKDQTTSIVSGFSRKATLKALIISLGLMIFQQLCGINAVIFYSTSIFEQANAGIEGKLATIIIGIVQVVGTGISVILIDRAGRRILLLISGFFMGVATLGLGVFFYLKEKDHDVSHLGWLPLSSLCLFIVMFSLGYGPVPWCMLGELFASDTKGPAGSIAGTSNWSLAFLVTVSYGPIKDAIGTGVTFWIFSVITFVGVAFVLVLVPETKGKSLKEIQAELGGE